MKTKSFLHIQKILFFSLLVTIACLLFAFSAAGEEYGITLNVVGETHGTVTLSVNGENQPFSNGTSYGVNGGDSYEIKITPNQGYEYNLSPELALKSDSVGRNITMTVTFQSCSYKIGYVDSSSYGFNTPKANEFSYASGLTLSSLPEKDGYSLIGWKLYVKNPAVSASVPTEFTSPNLVIPAETYDYDIWLEPIWKANSYAVFSIDLTKEGALLGYRVLKADYKTSVSAAVNQYNGFHRTESTVLSSVKISEGSESTTIADVLNNPGKFNVVYAYFEPNRFSVSYNDGGDQVNADFAKPTVLDYSKGLSIPNLSRIGYAFLGWKLSLQNGTVLDAEPVKDYVIPPSDPRIPDGEKLIFTAYWEANPYTFRCPNLTNATVTAKNGNASIADGDQVRYGTTVSISVTANAGYKIVSWMGKTISHVKEYSGTLTVGAQDATFSCVVLRSHATPSVTLSFAEETVCMAEGGNYLITCLGETQTLPENKNPTLTIAEHFWGKTLSIVRLGDGETFSDSEPYSLTLPSRAASPENSFSVETGAYGISVKRAEESSIPMEYAVSKSRTGEDLTWQDSIDFTDLEYGTAYYVFTRIKATDTHPASLPATPLRCTTRTPTLTDGEITLLFFTVIIVILAQIICLLFLANPKKKKATHRTNAFFLLTAQPTVWILSLPQTALLGVLLATAVTLQIVIVFKLLKK